MISKVVACLVGSVFATLDITQVERLKVIAESTLSASDSHIDKIAKAGYILNQLSLLN
jgi:hypothetical protein